MPRKLPWLNPAPAARSAKTTRSYTPVKRRKVEKSMSGSDADEVERAGNVDNRAGSTSPIPEAPAESYMEEGLGKDDQYRMVEDEFLRTAQQFTVHLHTAEYKRQKKMVKYRNAQTISSITRPVVGKMPDQTKRRVESSKLARAQQAGLAGLLGQTPGGNKDSDESDDDNGLPYIGTSLHGLMASPRRRVRTLANVVTAAKATRSAAGFKNPAGQIKDVKLGTSNSRQNAFTSTHSRRTPDHSSTQSSGDDDDLDAPILAPSLARVKAESYSDAESPPRSRRVFPKEHSFHGAREAFTAVSSKSTYEGVKAEQEARQSALASTDTRSSHSNVPRVSRLERAQKLQDEKERERKKKKNLDIIPTFL